MEREEHENQFSSNQLFKLDGYQICVICDQDEGKNELGTGFLFMRKDWIITAAHVIQVDGLCRINLYAQFPISGINKVKLKVISVHVESDIALLQIVSEENPCERPLFPGYDDLSVSKGLVCCGYTPSKGNTITIGLVKNYSKDFRHRKETEVIFEYESIDIEAGCSGGPIFGDGGLVLGIMINLFIIEEEPYKKFVRATSIQNLTKALSIDFNQDIMKPINQKEI